MDLISLSAVAEGLSILLDPSIYLFILIGAVIGLVFGAAPGLTATAAIAIVLPLTFDMPLTTSLALLLGVYCSGYFAGSIPAMLINTPGAPGNAATAIEGYPLARAGRGRYALGLATVSSLVGGSISVILLATIAPTLARFALNFTSVEYFALALLGLVCVAAISEGSLVKGCVAALIGVFISTVGIDPISGVQRLTFGMPELLVGFPIVPVLIGLFAITEMLGKTLRGAPPTTVEDAQDSSSSIQLIRDHWKHKWLALKSSLIGTFIGLLPGTGPAIASWVSYADAVRGAKPGDAFGKGEPKGIIACETSNNAVTGGALIPLLTLGIPGDPITAILIGALAIQGVEPGPFFIRDHSAVFISILALLVVSNLFMVVLGLSVRRLAAKICQVPAATMIAVIVPMAAVGGFAISNSTFEVALIMIFGLLGYFLIRYGFPVAAVVLGVVLGPILEVNLRNALIAHDMNVTVFFSRPVSLAILVAMVVLVVVWTRKGRRSFDVAPSRKATTQG